MEGIVDGGMMYGWCNRVTLVPYVSLASAASDRKFNSPHFFVVFREESRMESGPRTNYQEEQREAKKDDRDPQFKTPLILILSVVQSLLHSSAKLCIALHISAFQCTLHPVSGNHAKGKNG